MTLAFPDHLPATDRARVTALAERNLADHGDGFLGLVLSGSAGRGMATDRSDLGVFVVLDDEAAAGRTTAHSPEVDELAAALRRQATLTPDEADAVLIDHDRLDGWVNFAYRALKSDRDGRAPEARLDAAESVPWLLDVVFAMAGRVRPYNKYLAWELHTHPVDGWPADALLGLVGRSLDGDVGALRETFVRVRAACAAYDARRGHTRTGDMVDGWGRELDVFAGS